MFPARADAAVAVAGTAGLGQAETISDFGSMSSVGAFNECVRDGGIVVSSMPGAENQYHSCYPPSGGYIWCEGDFSACYRFEPVPEPPNELPGPGHATTDAPGTATSAPATGGQAGPGAAAGGAIQLHIQR